MACAPTAVDASFALRMYLVYDRHNAAEGQTRRHREKSALMCSSSLAPVEASPAISASAYVRHTRDAVGCDARTSSKSDRPSGTPCVCASAMTISHASSSCGFARSFPRARSSFADVIVFGGARGGGAAGSASVSSAGAAAGSAPSVSSAEGGSAASATVGAGGSASSVAGAGSLASASASASASSSSSSSSSSSRASAPASGSVAGASSASASSSSAAASASAAAPASASASGARASSSAAAGASSRFASSSPSPPPRVASSLATSASLFPSVLSPRSASRSRSSPTLSLFRSRGSMSSSMLATSVPRAAPALLPARQHDAAASRRRALEPRPVPVLGHVRQLHEIPPRPSASPLPVPIRLQRDRRRDARDDPRRVGAPRDVRAARRAPLLRLVQPGHDRGERERQTPDPGDPVRPLPPLPRRRRRRVGRVGFIRAKKRVQRLRRAREQRRDAVIRVRAPHVPRVLVLHGAVRQHRADEREEQPDRDERAVDGKPRVANRAKQFALRRRRVARRLGVPRDVRPRGHEDRPRDARAPPVRGELCAERLRALVALRSRVERGLVRGRQRRRGRRIRRPRRRRLVGVELKGVRWS
eukprot:31160-Pelagococcus_subviridis.AAC.17